MSLKLEIVLALGKPKNIHLSTLVDRLSPDLKCFHASNVCRVRRIASNSTFLSLLQFRAANVRSCRDGVDTYNSKYPDVSHAICQRIKVV